MGVMASLKRVATLLGACMLIGLATLTQGGQCKLCNMGGDGTCGRWADCHPPNDTYCGDLDRCGKGDVSVSCYCPGSWSCTLGLTSTQDGVTCTARDLNGSIICTYSDPCPISG